MGVKNHTVTAHCHCEHSEAIFLFIRLLSIVGFLSKELDYNYKLTNEIKDGLSAFIYPKDGNYVSFNLPLELFEKAVGTNNRFLIKIVDTVPKIVFAGPNQSGTTNDPKLNIEYSENTIPIPLPLEFFKIIGNIQNLQINYGGGNNMATNQDSKKENIFDKFFWKFLIPVAVVVVGAYLIYYFGIK